MCGRFVQYSCLEILQQAFDIQAVTCEVTPSYNIAPTHEILSVIRHDDENRLGKLHWGLVPSWAKDLSGASKLINARAETLMEKPSFRGAFKSRRCLVLADGYYEWKRENGHKQPWCFALSSGEPFAFAGLWETWKRKDEKAYHSCTIITTSSSKSVSAIHDRMPVILPPGVYDSWLNQETSGLKQLEAIQRECHIRKMRYYPVSTGVNDVKYNNPDCIKPIQKLV